MEGRGALKADFDSVSLATGALLARVATPWQRTSTGL